MKLIVGLGNPGEAYANTRHNIGFQCINYFSRLTHIRLSQRQCRAQLGIGEVAGQEVILAKPQTSMNRSGKAVSLLQQRFATPLGDVIVIYDDLDLPVGKIRLRQAGSSGGHKGMKSIINSLGSQDFSRLRVGIGHCGETPSAKSKVIDYVLDVFTPTEEVVIKEAIAKVAEAVICLLTEGIAVAMSKYN